MQSTKMLERVFTEEASGYEFMHPPRIIYRLIPLKGQLLVVIQIDSQLELHWGSNIYSGMIG